MAASSHPARPNPVPFLPPDFASTSTEVTDFHEQGHAVGVARVEGGSRAVHLDLATGVYTSNAAAETPLAEFARVAKAEHRIEECLERAKGEASLAQYQVRNWNGWHRHQTLSLLAAWFLTKEDLSRKQRGSWADEGIRGCLPRTGTDVPPGPADAQGYRPKNVRSLPSTSAAMAGERAPRWRTTLRA